MAHHGLSHNFEDTGEFVNKVCYFGKLPGPRQMRSKCSGRASQGSKFLSNTASDWSLGTTFSHHIHWHQALFYVQLGEFESALTLYDDVMGPSLTEGMLNNA